MKTTSLPSPDEDKIIGFIKNLEQSLLESLGRGKPIILTRKTDADPVEFQHSVPLDWIYMGTTFIIDIGRPANIRKCKLMLNQQIQGQVTELGGSNARK